MVNDPDPLPGWRSTRPRAGVVPSLLRPGAMWTRRAELHGIVSRRTVRWWGLLAAMVASVEASPAHADGYRGEMALADATGFGAMVLLQRTGISDSTLSVTPLVVSGAAVHLAHENYGRAAGSIALRGSAVYLTYALIDRCAHKHWDTDYGSVQCVLGAGLVGSLAASLALTIDYVALAKEPDGSTTPVMFSWQTRL